MLYNPRYMLNTGGGCAYDDSFYAGAYPGRWPTAGLGLGTPYGGAYGPGCAKGFGLYGLHPATAVAAYGTNKRLPLTPYTEMRRPYSTLCPCCNLHITTVTHSRVGSFATGAAICLSVVLLCWVPLCFKSFKDVTHYCPACGSQVAYHKTGRW
jgi:hypothetical protein